MLPQNNLQYPTQPTFTQGFPYQGQGFQTAVPLPMPAPQPQAQSLPQRSVIYGRPVNQIEEVLPQDVPMDGTCSLFPTNDGTAIYKKYWNSDGTIKTIKFVPETIPEQVEQPNAMEELKAYLDEKFDAVMTSTSTSTKKGGAVG